MTVATQASQAALISGISVPDSKLADEITEFIRDTESTLLFNHSSRVYYFGALAGQRRGFKFDAELLYAGAMFHDIGLVPAYGTDADRFEVDGANAARDFLRRHNISVQDIDHVWTAIALHTTPGIPQYMHPVVALRSWRNRFRAHPFQRQPSAGQRPDACTEECPAWCEVQSLSIRGRCPAQRCYGGAERRARHLLHQLQNGL